MSSPGMTPANARNLIGRKIGRLTVLERMPGNRENGWRTRWRCACECGGENVLETSILTREIVKSCGCIRNEKSGARLRKHGLQSGYGLSSEHLGAFKSWRAMSNRCLNPSAADFPRYGGSGVTICARWLGSFENFLADMGDRPNGLTLDRINPFEGYSPDNCRWATRKEQSNNRRISPQWKDAA